MYYCSRLHWWLFTPYKKAKKVAEVMLFTNAGTDMNLHLSFCQWPKDNSKVLVFGYLKSDLEVRESSMTYPVPCYITVTAVPSLKGCQDCIRVAAVSILDDLCGCFFLFFLYKVSKYLSTLKVHDV